ncbi:GNAT family N-acetyltransferase [Actinomadura sp. HBU206391]|uniref:GNAT family N-acetyltransferase n=1 Tax=Actinomadura sp. HBU206391 TaxID=2731692 RepID=UPI00164FD0D6|nr:GNAT family N-acetyltransferase [Actinomadura sp. HBU206391]MBC6462994.1 GNAT family N-acetyltransferase [Actinomadura sp. HBU206391]
MFGPIAETIETERLTLEPLTVSHADEMREVLGDPELHAFMGGEPATLAELRARYQRLVAGPAPFHQEGWLNWVVRRNDDIQAVGTVQATVTPGAQGPQASVAWVIGVPFQGRGYACEAAAALAGWLRDHSVAGLVANIHPDNLASAGVARHIGLHPTDQYAGDEVVWRG